MEYIHSSDVIMDIGKIIAGRFRGGPAKIACLTSALVGSISGSAAANVYATGTFTIPMMKKIGYKPAVAGAVEAIASTGGQIMPPVMGAAAFIMAEILGVPYIDICKAALVPAVFYYLNIFFLLDFLDYGRPQPGKQLCTDFKPVTGITGGYRRHSLFTCVHIQDNNKFGFQNIGLQ